MTSLNYDSSVAYERMKDATVYIISSHGEQDRINLKKDNGQVSFLTSSDLDEYSLKNCRLVLYSACETAKGGDYGTDNFSKKTYECGANTVIGFREKIRSGQANMWNEKFLFYLSEGYNIQSAADKSLSDVRYAPIFKNDLGNVDSIFIYGSKIQRLTY